MKNELSDFDKKRLEHQLDIIKAFLNGDTVQCKYKGGVDKKWANASVENGHPNFQMLDYRRAPLAFKCISCGKIFSQDEVIAHVHHNTKVQD